MCLEFVKLKALPSAYTACISEVVRRRVFGRILSDSVNEDLAAALNAFRDAESAKRRAFIAEYGMLPVDLVHGLTQMPGSLRIAYDHSKEEALPRIQDDIDSATATLRQELERTLGSSWSHKMGDGLEAKRESATKMELLKAETRWKAGYCTLTLFVSLWVVMMQDVP